VDAAGARQGRGPRPVRGRTALLFGVGGVRLAYLLMARWPAAR
jgi:hypothetical protein